MIETSLTFELSVPSNSLVRERGFSLSLSLHNHRYLLRHDRTLRLQECGGAAWDAEAHICGCLIKRVIIFLQMTLPRRRMRTPAGLHHIGSLPELSEV